MDEDYDILKIKNKVIEYMRKVYGDGKDADEIMDNLVWAFADAQYSVYDEGVEDDD